MILRRQLRKNGRRTRGQALVEFALVVPLFLFMLYAVIEAGRFVLAYEVANNAVREGTRYAIVHGYYSIAPIGPSAAPDNSCPAAVDASPVQSVVQKNAYTLATATSILVCWPDGTNVRGNRVRVAADFPFSVILPIPFPTLNIHAESTLVINN